MNPTQSALVNARGPALASALHDAAVAAHVTVSELVEAGIGRGGKSGGVMLAAERFERAYPGLLASFRESWPFECAFCGRSDLTQLERCPVCTKREGCVTCVTTSGCPTCRAAAAKARDDARREAEDRARNLAAFAALRDATDAEPPPPHVPPLPPPPSTHPVPDFTPPETNENAFGLVPPELRYRADFMPPPPLEEPSEPTADISSTPDIDGGIAHEDEG